MKKNIKIAGISLNIGSKDLNQNLITYNFSQALPLYKGLLLHAAAIVKDKKAYLFLAPSGGGKSTIADLSKNYIVLGDDVIAIRKKNFSYSAYPTPWKQRDFIKLDRDISNKVEAIFFIKKSKKISFKKIPKEKAFIKLLLEHIHFLIYTEKPIIQKAFSVAFDFIKNVDCYEMKFRKDISFWPDLKKTQNEDK